MYRKYLKPMTKLGEFLISKSVNKSEVSRKTGISKARLSELTTKPKTRLQATELYLIALAIGTDPCGLLEYLCGDLKRKV
jgi:DNA-binding Xre family transcriptional regulator